MTSTPRILVVEPDAADPVARLGEWFEAAGAELVVVRPYFGDPLPEDLAGFDALVVMGGRMGANDDADFDWLAPLRDLLAAAVRAQTPTLGVCLGSQLLGRATGGTVGPNPEGPEVGASLVAKRQAAAGDPLFRPLPITPDVLQWHNDAVTALPPGAELLMSSPGCATQAFRVGRLAWGVQFHVENTEQMVRDWSENSRRDEVRSAGRDLDAVEAAALALLPDLAETWQPFAAGFVDVARDPSAVKIARTVPSSTAAPIDDKAAIRAALAAEADAARGGVTPPDAPYGRPLPLAGGHRP